MAEQSIQIQEIRTINRNAPWLPIEQGNQLIRIINALGRADIVGRNGQPIGNIAISENKIVIQLEQNPETPKQLAAQLISTDAGNTLQEGSDGLLEVP